MGFLMPAHPLAKFEIQKCYLNEPRFNGVFSRYNVPKKIKDGTYVINPVEYIDVGTHWIALFCNTGEKTSSPVKIPSEASSLND